VVTGDEVAERLRAARSRWSTARGTARHWRRQDLVTLGFDRRRHAEEALGIRVETLTAWSEQATGGDEPARSDVYESVLAVHAAGERRRADALSRTGEEWMADSVVVDGSTFWARTGDEVLTNGGDPRSSHGGADFIRLLVPDEVPDGYALTPLGEREVVAGRPSDVVVAEPLPPDPTGETPESEVFDMVWGGDAFRLSIDRRTGVLLRVVKLVDEQPAEVHEFLELVLDEPLDDSVFLPPW
jgi:hypothetical protein